MSGDNLGIGVRMLFAVVSCVWIGECLAHVIIGQLADKFSRLSNWQ